MCGGSGRYGYRCQVIPAQNRPLPGIYVLYATERNQRSVFNKNPPFQVNLFFINRVSPVLPADVRNQEDRKNPDNQKQAGCYQHNPKMEATGSENRCVNKGNTKEKKITDGVTKLPDTNCPGC